MQTILLVLLSFIGSFVSMGVLLFVILELLRISDERTILKETRRRYGNLDDLWEEDGGHSSRKGGRSVGHRKARS